MRQPTRQSLDTSRPFTRAQAVAAGLTPAKLRGPRFRRLLRGVYVAASVPPSPDLVIAAVLLALPEGAFASHATAARLFELPIPTVADEHFGVLRPGDRRPHEGIRCHVCPSPDVVEVRGLRVSRPEQVFVELASLLGLVDLVVVGDRLVRTGRTTVERLVSYCANSTLPGARSAARAAAYVRPRVDSPMETRLRLLLVLSGLPEPEVNLTIRDVDGTPLRRYDLCWPSVKVIVEYDGRHHADRVEQWESDLAGREAIDIEEWRLLVVVSRGIYQNPGQTVDRVWRVLRSRNLAGLPARPADAWRAHFPGH
jgi:hypothetical protein